MQPYKVSHSDTVKCDSPLVESKDYLLSFLLSHCWLAMPQLVLQADWQEVWHSPHPPFFALAQRFFVSIVLMCFIRFLRILFTLELYHKRKTMSIRLIKIFSPLLIFRALFLRFRPLHSLRLSRCVCHSRGQRYPACPQWGSPHSRRSARGRLRLCGTP